MTSRTVDIRCSSCGTYCYTIGPLDKIPESETCVPCTLKAVADELRAEGKPGSKLLPGQGMGPKMSIPRGWAPKSLYFNSTHQTVELAGYEYRFYYDQLTSSIPGWGEWKTIRPHEDGKLKEVLAYIRGGYRYEIRPIYAAPTVGYVPDAHWLAIEQDRYNNMSPNDLRDIQWSRGVRKNKRKS